MNVNKYTSIDKTQLSPHFNIREFRCKCGKAHETLINTDLINKLEQLRDALNCSKIIVNSGYRCPAHDKAVGGTGSGQHTKGNAADVVCYGQDGQPISSKTVCCTAQDLGFGGIANITSAYTSTHLDVRTGSKWYGDEVYGTSTITNDFYSYFGISKSIDIDKSSAVFGIDVSEHQGDINWSHVKAEGVKFAIIRAGIGNRIDNQYRNNYAGCKSNEIPVGAYWYSYAMSESEARQEAELCLKTIAGKKLNYPLYIDIERSEQLNKTILNAVAKAFCKLVTDAGYTAGLYCSSYYVNTYLDLDFPYELWIADYNKKNSCKFPHGIWQYGVAGHPKYDTFGTGSVSGVSGQCDLDYCYKSYGNDTNEPENNSDALETDEHGTLGKILEHIKSIDSKLS